MKDVRTATMGDVSKDNPFSYCVFGVHANGHWCYQWRADTLELARTESRRLMGQGWYSTAIYFDGERVG